MNTIIQDVLERFIEQHVSGITVEGIIVIGSAASTRFNPQTSDVDVIIIAAQTPLTRAKVIMDNTFCTPVDYTLGTENALLNHYIQGKGKSFAWLLQQSVIYYDTPNGSAQKFVAAVSQAAKQPISASPEPAWRIGLTNRCNFGCFFCHSEGLSHTANYEAPDFEQIYTLILHGIQHNCRDFTLTGGEPLLYAREITRLLYKLSAHPQKPALTIVTNGMLLSEDLLTAAQHYQDIKFNVSYHATDRSIFQKIIQRQGHEFESVNQNILLLQKYQLRFGVNYVLLRNLNDTPQQIEEVLAFAQKVGAENIKFLELLVTNQLLNYFDSYCDARYIIHLLQNRLIPSSQLVRRHEYRLAGSNLKIFIQRCRCSLGCNQCLDSMDRIITPDGCYEPCFSNENTTHPLDDFNLTKVFAQGDQLIHAMAKKYGKSSPLLFSDPEYKAVKLDYFYLSPLSASQCRDYLLQAQAKLERMHHFKETFYRPCMPDDHSGASKIYKSFINNDFPDKHHLFTAMVTCSPDAMGALCTHTYFLAPQGPREFNSEALSAYLVKEQLEPWFSSSWQIQHFSHGNAQLTVGTCLSNKTAIICSLHTPLNVDIQNLLSAKPLLQPLREYIGNSSA